MNNTNNDFSKKWFLALRDGEIDKLRYIARDNYIDVDGLLDKNYNTSLINAAIGQKYDVCEYLINELGASILIKNHIKRTPLIEAIRCRSSKWNKNFIKLFLSIVNEQDGDGRTALMFASIGAGLFGSKRGNIQIIKQLLDAGADINIQDNLGYTALGHAQSSNKASKTENNQEVVEFLEKEHVLDIAIKKFHERYSYTFNNQGVIVLSNKKIA